MDKAPQLFPVDDKATLISALEQLTPDVFEFFVLWANGANVNIPDDANLDGFRPDQVRQILALRAAARAYISARSAVAHG